MSSTACVSEVGDLTSRATFVKGACGMTAAAILGAFVPHCASADEAAGTEDLAAQVQYLTDYVAISECQYRYALGVDGKDIELLTNDVFDTYINVSYPDGTVIQDKLGREMAAGIVTSFADKGINTQHFLTVYNVDIDGDEATAITYMRATHTMEGMENYIGGGYYTNSFVRTPDGWRIKSVTLTNVYREGVNFTY